MTFYERYAIIAEQQNLDPCSQKAADMFGVTKAALSTWNTKATTPKGTTVALIADKLGISADYLLGRTDDPTDHTKNLMNSPESKTVPIHGVGKTTPGVSPSLLLLYNSLDDADKLKAEGVIQGMLMQDKYTSSVLANAAHARTDIQVTPEMITHDENIMDSEDF